MRIHYDNMARSGILTEFIDKNDLYKNYHMIDMCTGSGSFLIWALKQGLFPNRAILVDNDINLLKSIKSNLRQNFKNIYVIKSNTNNLDLTISDKSQQKSNVSIVKENCDTYEVKDTQPHIISYSAAIDLMSKSSIDICLSKIKDENILFLSLCFDGKVKWKPSHPYDKYIMSYFNKHQSYDKGFGKALGYKSIDYVNKKAKQILKDTGLRALPPPPKPQIGPTSSKMHMLLYQCIQSKTKFVEVHPCSIYGRKRRRSIPL